MADAVAALSAQHPELPPLWSHLRIPLNEELLLDQSHPLAEGDTLALLPPVSGGAPHVRLSEAPIGLDEVVAAVRAPSRGGLVTFSGLVRDHSQGKEVARLFYEAYAPMALRALAQIVTDIERDLPGVAVAIVHRTGELAIGDVAVVIAAAAPHRAEAFTACQRAINTLKQTVPIWKKEFAQDGATWVTPTP